MKDKVIRDTRNLFKQGGDYYKPARVGNFWNNNYTEYQSNRDKDKTLSFGKYVNKIRPYLKGIINDIKSLSSGKSN